MLSLLFSLFRAISLHCILYILPYTHSRYFVGLAEFYVCARAKHFGCHSVCQCVITGVHFEVIKLEHPVSAATIVFFRRWEKLLSILFLYLKSHTRYTKSKKLEEVRFSETEFL